MNGDVVFDPAMLGELAPLIEADQSFVAVDTSVVSDEEVKYTVDGDGHILELSKAVKNALGEAVGINYVASGDKKYLVNRLQKSMTRSTSKVASSKPSSTIRCHTFRSISAASMRWKLILLRTLSAPTIVSGFDPTN